MVSTTMHAPTVATSFEALERTTLSRDRADMLARGAPYEVRFAIGSTVLAVAFSEADAADDLRDRYRDMIVAADAPVADRSFAVAGARETSFWSDPANVWRWNGPPLAGRNVAFFADIVACNEYLRRSEHVGFHAAVVASDHAAATIVGASTAGKTTTAVACVRAGLLLYSDERCIVVHDRVVAFPRRMTLRAGGREALLRDGASGARLRGLLERWRPHDDVAFAPSEFAPGRVGGEPLPLACAFVLDGYGDRPRLERVSAAELAPALLSSMMSREEPGLARFGRLLATFRETAVFRLRLGDPAASAEAIVEALAREERRYLAR